MRNFILQISLLFYSFSLFAQGTDNFDLNSTRWYFNSSIGTEVSYLGNGDRLGDNSILSIGIGHVLFHKESNYFLEFGISQGKLLDIANLNNRQIKFRNKLRMASLGLRLEPNLIRLMSFFAPKFRGYLARPDSNPIFQVDIGAIQHDPEAFNGTHWERLGSMFPDDVKRTGILSRLSVGFNTKISQRADLFLLSSWHITNLENVTAPLNLETQTNPVNIKNGPSTFWNFNVGVKLWLAKGTKKLSVINEIDNSISNRYGIEDFTFQLERKDYQLVYDSAVNLNLMIFPNRSINSGDVPISVRFTHGFDNARASTPSSRHSFPIREDLQLDPKISLDIPLDAGSKLVKPSLDFSLIGKKGGQTSSIALKLRTIGNLYSNQIFPRLGVLLRERNYEQAINFLRAREFPATDFAITYILMGEYEKAREILETVIQRAPLIPLGHYLLACVLSHQSKFDDSIVSLFSAFMLENELTSRQFQLRSLARHDYELENVRLRRASKFYEMIESDNILANAELLTRSYLNLNKIMIESNADLETHENILRVAFDRTQQIEFKYELGKLLFLSGRPRESLEALNYISSVPRTSLSDKDVWVVESANNLKPDVEKQVSAEEKLTREGLKKVKEAVGTYYSLFIIQEDYGSSPDSPYNDLDSAYRLKSEEIIDLLRLKYGFKKRNSIELRNAKKVDIIRAFHKFRNDSISPNSSLLIFYSGHGDTFGGKQQDRGFWCPTDIVKPFGEPPIDNFLENRELTRIISNLPMKHILVVSDACYAGLLGLGSKGTKSDIDYEMKAKKYSRFVLTSIEDTGFASGIEFLNVFHRLLDENPLSLMEAEVLFHKLFLRLDDIPDYDQIPGFHNIRGAYPLNVPSNDHGSFMFISNKVFDK